MKITELIKKLNKELEKEGDLDVLTISGGLFQGYYATVISDIQLIVDKREKIKDILKPDPNKLCHDIIEEKIILDVSEEDVLIITGLDGEESEKTIVKIQDFINKEILLEEK